jgi:primosomal protein N' (replication factor Y) (superfamily II helicase)
MRLVRVAVPIPKQDRYVYSLPDGESPEAGLRVLVPLGRRRLWGTVLEEADAAPRGVHVRSIAGIPEPRIQLPPEIVSLCSWVAEYYAAGLGETLAAAAPTLAALTRRAPRAGEDESDAGGAWHATPPPARNALNPEQTEALEALEGSLASGGFRAFLLYGVTGSGKTAVYLHAALAALRAGRQALVLVPEIALAPQAADAFRRAGVERVALYHSELRPRERVDVWRRAASGELDVIVGTRSAVFLPLVRPGLIVVDEEQDGAYKQDESPRYHARDVALVRAQRLGITAVLSSATPSLESYARAERGDCSLLRLTHRVDRRPLASVRLADLRRRPKPRDGSGSKHLTPPLLDAMARTLERGEQGILFLNRRGHSTYLQCKGCGGVARCASCDVPLTVHAEDASLRCHYCNATRKLDPACPACGAADLWFGGVGIQKIEREVARLFPAARLARLDLDSVRRRGSAAAILNSFREGQIDFLLGTQMVAKGFDFPGVTLVGVIVADLQLYLPDFRAAERTFQLLTQVAGRAGRGAQPGEVIMQSYDPDHPALRAASAQDFGVFYAREARERQELAYPPFGYLVEIEISGTGEARVQRAGALAKRALAESARSIFGRTSPSSPIEVLGPAPKPLARLKGKERWHLLARSRSRPALRAWLEDALPRLQALKIHGVRITVDVDPHQLL